MTEMDHSVVFYQKTAELEEKLRKREEARLRALQDSYDRFLKEHRKRRKRNDRILQTLHRIENQAAMMAAKTDRLKLLRQHYEAYLMRVYPEWKLQNQIPNGKGYLHVEKFRPLNTPHQYMPSNCAEYNSAAKLPTVPQTDAYRNIISGPADSNPVFIPSLSVTDYPQVQLSRSPNKISTMGRNILPSKNLGVIASEQAYVTKQGSNGSTHGLDLRSGQLESNAGKSLRLVGSGILKPNEDSRLGSIYDFEAEQNTSRDLLNLSLSDDGILQEDLPVHNARLQDDVPGMLSLALHSVVSNDSKTKGQIPKIKPEHDLFPKIHEAGVRVPEHVTRDNIKGSSRGHPFSLRQEEGQIDAGSFMADARHDGSGFHESAERMKLNDIHGSNLREKHLMLSLGKTVQPEAVEMVQQNLELVNNHQSIEPLTTNQILQKENKNTQLRLFSSGNAASQSAASMAATNRVEQNVVVPLKKIINRGQERDSNVNIQLSIHSDENYEYRNKRDSDHIGEKNTTVLHEKDSKKDNVKFNEHNDSDDYIAQKQAFIEKRQHENDIPNNSSCSYTDKINDDMITNIHETNQQEKHDEKLIAEEAETHKNVSKAKQYSVDTGQYKSVDNDLLCTGNETELYQAVGEDGEYISGEMGYNQVGGESKLNIVDEAGQYESGGDKGQYQNIGEEEQYIVDKTGKCQEVGEKKQFVVDESGHYQNIDDDTKFILDETGQSQDVGDCEKYIGGETEHHQTFDNGRQIFADEAGQYQKVDEDGQYIVDEEGQYQTVGEEEQYYVDETGQYQKVGEEGQYIVDEAGQYQKVGEDGQYIVDEAGQYQTVGEEGQYYVDETGQYQKVGEEGQYIVDEAGQYQKVGEDGQYIVDESGQYQEVGEEGQYIVDETGQYQKVDKEGEYIVDETGQYQQVDEKGQYIVDDTGQYQAVGEGEQYAVDEAGQYIVDESGQYQRVGEDGQYFGDETGQYQEAGEEEQYYVDDAGQFQKVGKDGQYFVDEAGQYQIVDETGKYSVDEAGLHHTVGEGAQNTVEIGDHQRGHEGEMYSEDKPGEYETGATEKNTSNESELNQYHEKDEGYTVDKKEQFHPSTDQEQNNVSDGREHVTAKARVEQGIRDDHSFDPVYVVEGCKNIVGVVEADDKEEREEALLGVGHPTDRSSSDVSNAGGPGEVKVQSSSSVGNLDNSDGMPGAAKSLHGSEVPPQRASNMAGRGSQVGDSQPGSGKGDEVAAGEQQLSREAMNQRVRDVLGGLGQETSDESSEVPALRQPLLPSKSPAAKKLPGLSRTMESDSDSLQLNANDDSDDFDFSSEK
ncbi:uncharacterized protein LOC134531141 isoform X2 [Bacillus rossius redtenbacheri]|uniref:uncharacterized protein LOC134531141 isoform X2 n=1 Tax=Bacillus rossius redtenbacheri TaxID=93214 RepID=UPI002FDE99D2